MGIFRGSRGVWGGWLAGWLDGAGVLALCAKRADGQGTCCRYQLCDGRGP